MKAFYEDRIREASEEYLPKSDVHDVYKEYCQKLGMDHVSRKKFTSRLKSLGIKDGQKRIDDKPTRCFHDIKIE